MLVLFYKPFGVLCQFSGEGLTLKEHVPIPDIYPAGRLDKDSEGLLVLTDDGRLQDRLTHPKYGKHKVFGSKSTAQQMRRPVSNSNKAYTERRPGTCDSMPPN